MYTVNNKTTENNIPSARTEALRTTGKEGGKGGGKEGNTVSVA